MNLRRSVVAMTSVQQPQSTIIVVGLNAALQKRFVLPPNESLIPGNVHRAVQVQTGVGGKGQDVAIALNCLSSTAPQQLVQFVGKGSAGDAVYQMLVDQLGDSSMGLTVRSSTEMRTCTSIVASDETTELVEPSGVITNEEMEELLNKLSGVNNQARAVCIMGSMPPGCPTNTYAEILSKAAGPASVCVVDSVAGIDSLIKTAHSMGSAAGSMIFKINASELCKLAGISKSNSETGGVVLSELVDAIRQFVDKYNPEVTTALLGLAITDGRHPAYLASFADGREFKLFRLKVPELDSTKTLYPIGAGDAVAAGTLAAWASLASSSMEGSTCVPLIPEECFQSLEHYVKSICKDETSPKVAQVVSAFAFGLICGSASCLQEENSVLDSDDVKKLFGTVDQPEQVLTQSFAES